MNEPTGRRWPRAGGATSFDNVVEDIESVESDLVIMSQAQKALSRVITVLPGLTQGMWR